MLLFSANACVCFLARRSGRLIADAGQRLVLAPLAEFAGRVEEAVLTSPAIIVVGAVVAQRVAACAPQPATVVMPIPL